MFRRSLHFPSREVSQCGKWFRRCSALLF